MVTDRHTHTHTNRHFEILVQGSLRERWTKIHSLETLVQELKTEITGLVTKKDSNQKMNKLETLIMTVNDDNEQIIANTYSMHKRLQNLQSKQTWSPMKRLTTD